MDSIGRTTRTAKAWLALGLVAALTLALVAGLLYSVITTLSRDDAAPEPATADRPRTAPAPVATTDSESAQQDARDDIAAEPMLQLPASAARPQPMVTHTAGPPIAMPAATDTTGLVATGFPQTPEGALAQLAAIDALALRDLNPAQVLRVYEWAAEPGAVQLQRWTPYVAAAAALGAASVPEGTADLASTFTPVAGQVKGVVGDDFVVACVLGEWQVTYRETARAGAADCQRMVWADGRWRIGAGEQPAYGPSAWPGSADAVRAGWRALTDA